MLYIITNKQKMTEETMLPDMVLKGYGCRNCAWKLFDSCPHSTDEDYVYDKDGVTGYCPDLVNFIFSLGEPGDTSTMLREKFQVYLQEHQAMCDLGDYGRLKRQYDSLNKNSSRNRDELERLKIEMNGYKMWWSRLSDSVTRGHGKIADRQSRKDTTLHIDHKISLNQIHRLAQAAKPLLDTDDTDNDTELIE